ncbi:MAG: potassium-transporting ATPase subunit B, partial [Devosia sp.]
MSTAAKSISILSPAILVPALRDAFIKLDPRQLLRNPVIFVTEVVAVLVTVLFVQDIIGAGDSPAFSGQIALWLWFTVLFATFAESVAEGRGKAQAESLKRGKSDLVAKKLTSPADTKSRAVELIPATALKIGDIILVEVNDLMPGDGEVIEGVASVNESAITGESAPVIREAG